MQSNNEAESAVNTADQSSEAESKMLDVKAENPYNQEDDFDTNKADFIGAYINRVIQNEVKPVGPWQLIMIAFLIVPLGVPVGIFSVFQTHVPKFQCYIPELANISYDEQLRLVGSGFPVPNQIRIFLSNNPCVHWQYQNFSVTANENGSLVPRVDLLGPTKFQMCPLGRFDHRLRYNRGTVFEDIIKGCKNFAKTKQLANSGMIGMVPGSILAGLLADVFGRKKVIVFTKLLSSLFALINTFATELITYRVCQVMLGCWEITSYTAAFVLLSELTTARYRSMFGAALTFGAYLVFGANYMVLVYYLTEHWKTTYRIFAATQLTVLISWFILPESPAWLISKGRLLEAERVFKQGIRRNVGADAAARFKLRILPEHLVHLPRGKDWLGVAWLQTKRFFRSGTLILRLVLMAVVWLVGLNIYYLFFFNASSIKTMNIYQTILLTLNITAVGDLFGVFIYRWFQRKIPMLLLMVGQAITLLCIMASQFNEEDQLSKDLTTVFCMIGVVFGGMTTLLLYMYATEIFPTEVRIIGLGFCGVLSRIGGMYVVDFLLELKARWLPLPWLIAGTCQLVASLCIFLLPNFYTDSKLPTTIEEMQATREAGSCGGCCPVTLLRFSNKEPTRQRTTDPHAHTQFREAAC